MDSPHSHSSRPLHPNTALYRVPSLQASARSVAPNRRPSMTATAFDPAAATDFRTFYPYVPNEVKHRKRTTRSQQAILEDVFHTNTKPNAAVRKELALQLDMQARGVQVWFQNRRAKEKKRLDTLIAHKSPSNLGRPSSPSEVTSPEGASPRSSAEDISSESPCVGNQHVSIDINVQSYPSSSPESSPSDEVSPHIGRLTSWPGSPTNQGVASGGLAVPDAHLLSLRRGSLPVNAFAQTSHHSATLGPPAIDSIDPLARRRSVDTSLHRLAQHPYARLAMEKNGLLGPYGSSGFNPYHQQINRVPPNVRSGMFHRGSLPGPTLNTHLDNHTLRYPNSGVVSPSPSPLSPSYAARAGLVDRRAYNAPRSMPMNLPGPLPSPSFSFGAPAESPPDFSPPLGENECGSSDMGSDLLPYSFPLQPEECDEDETSSASHSAFSRGSIISLGSESSNTSAYYSEVSSPVNYDSRRGSCASTGFLDLMNGLDMSCPSRHGSLVDAHSRRFSSQENSASNLGSSPNDCSSTSYPSPTPTISASPENRPAFNISKSSELAYALTGKQEESTPENTTVMHKQFSESQDSPTVKPEVPAPTQQSHQYFYGNETPIYSQSGPSSSTCSSLSLPMVEFSNQYEDVSSTGNYHTAPYSEPHYTNSGHFVSGVQSHPQQQQDYATHRVSSTDAFTTYHTVDPSVVGPAPQHGDAFVAYA